MARSIAIVLAGGSGERAGLGGPKQMALLVGRPVILHCLERFERHAAIDAIVVVANPHIRASVEAAVNQGRLSKVASIIDGGKQRHESSAAGIRACEFLGDGAPLNILIHDAARPLVSARTIDAVIKALERYAAVDTAIAAADTVILVDPMTDHVADIPERHRVRLSQTPQGFHHGLIKQAYERAAADPNFRATDDCGVVRRYFPNEPISVVEGSHSALKLTYPHDLALLEAMISLESSQ